jgi:sterol 3beta-glucosyltransferase
MLLLRVSRSKGDNMRIAIVTIGTIGDIVPYVALGKSLQLAGDQVRIITFQDFEELIRRNGLDFRPLTGRMSELMKRGWTQSQIKKGSSGQAFRQITQVSKSAQKMFEQLMTDTLDGCNDVDLVLGQVIGHLVAREVAQKLGVPYCAAFVAPLSRTRAFPGSFSLFPSAPGWHRWGKGMYNWLTQTLSARIFWSLIRPVLKKARQAALGLPSGQKSPCYPLIYGYSPAILPKPVEWGPHITVTGYWFMDQAETWQPPTGLLEFLATGTPPVYVGFGSMSQAARAATGIVVQALTELGLRFVLLGEEEEWRKLQKVGMVFCIPWAPHEWLFPRMALVMHHGGAGTTGLALQAGVPQIIVPFIADQHFWGHLVAALQVGPAPLKHKKLQVAQVEQAIAMATTEAVRNRAKAISERISAEDGNTLAVQTIHACIPATQEEKDPVVSCK